MKEKDVWLELMITKEVKIQRELNTLQKIHKYIDKKIQACENVKELQGLAPEIKQAGSKEILAAYSAKLQELWSK